MAVCPMQSPRKAHSQNSQTRENHLVGRNSLSFNAPEPQGPCTYRLQTKERNKEVGHFELVETVRDVLCRKNIFSPACATYSTTTAVEASLVRGGSTSRQLVLLASTTILNMPDFLCTKKIPTDSETLCRNCTMFLECNC